MSFRCLIVDDEELARTLIAAHLELVEEFEVMASSATAIEARNVLKSEEVDLIFLDIEMPVLKGTDFVKTMPLPPVIFTTAHRNFAIEAFELGAIDYLLKPITFERFLKALEKFVDTRRPTVRTGIDEKKEKQFIFLRINRRQVKIPLVEVIYIESIKDYVRVHMTSGTHMIKYSLSAFYALLDKRFLRVHRSFIVNMDMVTAYTRSDLEIGNKEIAIGNYYRNEVDRYFQV